MSYTTGRQKPPRSAINRNPPKPYGARLDGMARRAEEIALNRSRSLAGRSGRPRRQSAQVTGDRWFESISLQRRVCKPSVPQQRRAEEGSDPSAADPGCVRRPADRSSYGFSILIWVPVAVPGAVSRTFPLRSRNSINKFAFSCAPSLLTVPVAVVRVVPKGVRPSCS